MCDVVVQERVLSVVERTVVDDILRQLLTPASTTDLFHGLTAHTTINSTAPSSTPSFASAFPALSFVSSSSPAPSASASTSASAASQPALRRLQLRVFGFKAFMDHLPSAATSSAAALLPPSAASASASQQKEKEANAATSSGLVWVVACFGGRRSESRAVPATIDPAIDCTFSFPLQVPVFRFISNRLQCFCVCHSRFCFFV
jgi:hypothetical protein